MEDTARIDAPFLVLYDGDCGFCHRSVQFILPRDKKAHFRFAPLQSDLAAEIFARQGRALTLDSFILVQEPGAPGERLLSEGDAALGVGRGLGGVYAVLAALGRLVPRLLRNAAYRLVAKNRHRIGGAPACLIPAPEHRARFLHLDAAA